MAELRLDVRRENVAEMFVERTVDIQVDGASIPDVFGGVGMRAPEVLLPSTALIASEAPHYATVVRCGCGDSGCGSVTVRIRRDGDDVIWDEWQSTLDHQVLSETRFSGAQYDAELARADTERSWESAGERLARHLVARRHELEWIAEQWAYEIAPRVADARDDHAAVILHYGRPGTNADAWEVWVHLAGTADDAIAAFAQGPRSWGDVEYYGRTRHAEGRPPPRAGSHWRVVDG